jgi:hypothetical protein
LRILAKLCSILVDASANAPVLLLKFSTYVIMLFAESTPLTVRLFKNCCPDLPTCANFGVIEVIVTPRD